MNTLFTIRIELTSGERFDINYFCICEFMRDIELKSMFNNNLIKTCCVYQGVRRVTAIPVMEWDRLKDNIISNATTILRNPRW